MGKRAALLVISVSAANQETMTHPMRQHPLPWVTPDAELEDAETQDDTVS